MRKLLTFVLFTVLLTCLGCRKPFNPESITGYPTALIVEGVINPAGITNIYLSRTQDLDDKAALKPELKATVQVLSENNTAINLIDRGAGLYSIPQITLNPAQKYRLKIKLASGSEYMSEPMAVLNTPAIDKFYWVRDGNGVGIYVDAHDAQNNTKYYQWDFEEDWELRSLDFSEYKAVPSGTAIIDRDFKEAQLMFICYKHQRSNSIDIFSTAKLSADVVSKHTVMYIPNNSEKLDVRYSIIVRQHAISFEAFEYLSMMKRNTEQLGSFFDAQPTELIGNISNTNNDDDIAIGFIEIAPVMEKRIFIDRGDVLGWGFSLGCNEVSVRNHPDSLSQFYQPGAYIPRYPIRDGAGPITRWVGNTESCMDCRVRGGNNNKPSFW